MNWIIKQSFDCVYGKPNFFGELFSYYGADNSIWIRSVINSKVIYKYDNNNRNLRFYIKEGKLYFLNELEKSLYKFDHNTNTLCKVLDSNHKGQPGFLDNIYGIETISSGNWRIKENTKIIYLRETKKLLWKKTFTHTCSIIKLDKGYFKTDLNHSYFTKINIETGEELWTYYLSDGASTSGKIHTYENLLIIPSLLDRSDGPRQPGDLTLTCLNMETGKIAWQEHASPLDYHFDEKNSQLVSLGGRTLKFIDINTGQTIAEKKFHEFEDLGIYIQATDHNLYGDELFFVRNQHRGAGDYPSFGSINIRTQELNFIQKIETDDQALFDAPIFHQDKIYLKNKASGLYIYEKA